MMDAGRRERAIQTLGEMKSVRAVPRLLALWDDMGGDLAFDQRQATRKALAAIGRPGLPLLKKALNDPETRGVAMQAIKDIEREEDRGQSLVEGVMR
jgi:HEAT repeat protein